MTTQLNQAILETMLKWQTNCLLVGLMNSELNHYFTFYPFHGTREKVEIKYDHKTDTKFVPIPLPRLERKLTHYGDERILKTDKNYRNFSI